MSRLVELQQALEAEIVRGLDAEKPAGVDPEVWKVIVAENCVRAGIECGLHSITPFDPAHLAELAVRTVAYLMTAAPDDRTRGLILRSIEQRAYEAYQRKAAKGFKIDAKWAAKP